MSSIKLLDNQYRSCNEIDCDNKPTGLNGNDKKFLKELALKAVDEITANDNVFFVGNSLGREKSQKDRHIIEYSESENGEVAIYTENIMGFLSLENTHLQIRSRFESGDNNYFLFYMLSKAGGFSSTSYSALMGKDINALDIYPLIFPKMLRNALKQGVFRMYKKNEYNDMKLRGTVNVARHIKSNIPFNGKIAYTARNYQEDNPVIELVRHTIEEIKKTPFGKTLSANKDYKSDVETIVSLTPNYNKADRNLLLKQNRKKVNHPYYTHYKELQSLCLTILKHKKASYSDKDKKDKKEIHGIIFDGAWLWEEYIAITLKDLFKHYTDSSHFHLFKNGNNEFQKIIPDYLSNDFEEEKGKCKAAADAKYMFLENRDELPSEKAAAVYYKTIMYMYRFQCDMGMIFYPVKTPENETKGNDYTEFSIPSGNGKFWMMGLAIPQNVQNGQNEPIDLGFSNFCEKISDFENNYRAKIGEVLEISNF